MPAEHHRQPSISLERVAAIIPAYNAGSSLIALVSELRQIGLGALVIVDDGSAPEHHAWIDEACAEPHSYLLRHERNFGKGRALKTGFTFVAEELLDVDVIVTADADGQHRPQDIARVADAALGSFGRTALGSRTLSRDVPWRSWLGNRITRGLFAAIAGIPLRDTQTGLRAFPRTLLTALCVIEGERYEYETAVLLHLCFVAGTPIEVPIQTIYFQDNRGTHFRSVRDSARVYGTLLVFAVRRLRRGRALQTNADHT